MAFTYAMCACLLAMSIAVYGRSISEPNANDLGVSHTNGLWRIKRNIMFGSAGNGCAIGAFRYGRRCYHCSDIGKKLGKPMKICHGNCIEEARKCTKRQRGKIYA